MRTTEELTFKNNGNNVNLTEYISMNYDNLDQMIKDREADLTMMRKEQAKLQFEIKMLKQARAKKIASTIKTESNSGGGRKTRHRRSRGRRMHRSRRH